MPPSRLPLTGTCHYAPCGKPCTGRFCCPRHGDLYGYRKRNPVVLRVQKSKADAVRLTEKKLTWADIERRIEAIAARNETQPHSRDPFAGGGKSLRCRRVG